ncbi:MAG: hypothetical protein H5T84_05710 [Thermoleophilia bacterium]|nr:hypothetical protein [Thermoleophilia bacterium]
MAEGYLSKDILGCQFSIYPLQQADIDTPIQAAIEAAAASGCAVRVGNLSTLLWGSEEEIFAALRAALKAATASGPAVMSATLAPGMPSDELVRQIQGRVTPAELPSEAAGIVQAARQERASKNEA